MQITIFEGVTTSKILESYAEKASGYTGLYVDMNNADERRMVKAQAEEITALLKKLDRARIDKTKESKSNIDAEFAVISESLKKSNEPFTLLIDEHKAERKRVLDEEKAVQKAKDDHFQMGVDHTDAINENELYDLRKEKAKDEQVENEKRILAEIERRAKQAEIEAEEKRIRDVEQAKVDEQNRLKAEADREQAEKLAREANQEHAKQVMTGVKESLMQLCHLDEIQARAVTLAIKNGLVFNTHINF